MTTDYQPDREYLRPKHLVIGLLVVECMLWLSDRGGWPGKWDKCQAANDAVGVVGFVLSIILVWYIAALLFRWPFQFSIRSLLLLVIAVTLPFSWLAVEIQQTKRERQAVVEIEKLGGRITYDWQLGAKPEPPQGPAWLRSILGDYFFASVRRVSLNARFDDAELECLKGLTQLEALNLSGNYGVTDVGLGHLKGLRQLREIDLHGTKVTDAGVAKLQQALPNCKITH